MADEIATLLKYANVQMAAEALFGVSSSTSPGAVVGPTSIDVGWLTTGNNRASQFTEVAATQFAQEWSIVEHKSSTTTGFSGTLFKNNQTGEMVLSLRSTEFIDDAARDNQATNSMEISKFGWAFGQIDDMQQWLHTCAAQ